MKMVTTSKFFGLSIFSRKGALARMSAMYVSPYFCFKACGSQEKMRRTNVGISRVVAVYRTPIPNQKPMFGLLRIVTS
jgi:hypothetical protein